MVSELSTNGINSSTIRSELQQALRQNRKFAEHQVLYSMCNEPQPLAVEAHAMFVESNLGDPGLYPGTRMLEDAVLNILLNLLHGVPKPLMDGMAVSGGSEANIAALWMSRNLTKETEVILPESAHYSFEIAADMLGLRIVRVGLDSEYRARPDDIRAAIGPKTAVVVATAGTTETGQIDPIPEIQQICLEREKRFHVDAAFGGMVFPFLKRTGQTALPEFDFNLLGVSTMTVDPHKMGQATAPAGAILVRNPKDFDSIEHDAFYLSAPELHSILGTRCSAGVASAYAMMRFYGEAGYDRLLQECMQKTRQLVKLLKESGFTVAIEPISPVVCIRFDDLIRAKAIKAALAQRNFYVSQTRNPPGIRVVLMPHIPAAVVTEFVTALKASRK